MAALALFAVLALLARLWSLQVPLSEDAGAYLYVGDVIRDGGLPYVDAADNKGPLTYLLFGALDIVSGGLHDRSSAHARAGLRAHGTGGGGARPPSRGRLGGLAAGAAMAILGSTPLPRGEDLNTEQYGVLPLAAAWWLAARGGVRSAIAAGALVAVAVLMNVGFVALAPVIALELWFAGDHGRGRRFAAAAGGAAGLAAIPLVWLLLSGAFDDMWTQVIDKAGIAVGGDLNARGFDDTPLFDIPTKIPFLLGAAGAALALGAPALRVARQRRCSGPDLLAAREAGAVRVRPPLLPRRAGRGGRDGARRRGALVPARRAARAAGGRVRRRGRRCRPARLALRRGAGARRVPGAAHPARPLPSVRARLCGGRRAAGAHVERPDRCGVRQQSDRLLARGPARAEPLLRRVLARARST